MILVILVAVLIGLYLKNVTFLNSIVLIALSFNTLYWLLKTGQFFQLEIISFTLALLLLSRNYLKSSILLFFLFGIQKIYFLIISFYFAIKYFKLKGFTAFISMFAIINIFSFRLVKDYFNFWFSEEGYLFGKRIGRHSFFEEKFGYTNSSLMTLIKDILNNFNLNISNLLLLVFYALLISLFYSIFSKYIISIDESTKDYLNILFFIIVFPLMKPYVYIYFSIGLVFLLNNLKDKYLETFTTLLISTGTLGVYILLPYMYINTSELSNSLIIQYRFFQYSNFYISWTIFTLIIIASKKGGIKID